MRGRQPATSIHHLAIHAVLTNSPRLKLPIPAKVVGTAAALARGTAEVTVVEMGVVTAAGTAVEMGGAARGRGTETAMGMGTGMGIAPILMAALAPDRVLEQAKVVTAELRGLRQGASIRSPARRCNR